MEDRVLILDGGMGTMIQEAGMPAGEHPEVFGYRHPEVIKDIHKKYLLAGAQVLYANTFGANAHKLAGCPIDTETAICHGIRLAREAIRELKEAGAKDVFGMALAEKELRVAADVGPIGELLEPLGTLRFEEAYAVYREVMCSAKKAGADLIAIETFTDLYDAKAAVLAAKEHSDLPVWVTMTYEQSGRTFTGTKIASMAVTLEGLGIDAIGFNCSLGPKEIFALTRELREWTSLPIIIKPNAGLPNPATNLYDLSAEDFGKDMQAYMSLGVSCMGGCCGTTPAYIRSLIEHIRSYSGTVKEPPKRRNGICSSSLMVEYGGVKVVGERLNPTGKKRFAAALLERDMDYICAMALEQEESGADVLDVNVGVPGADEAALMTEVVKTVQSIVSLPLQIDSSNPEAIEAGLRVCNGKAIINSVNADEEKLEAILPLARKYGAAVVGLAMNEGGIPQTAEERVAHARHIMERAIAYGIPKEDIIIDCLTLTVSAQQEQARETLQAVRRVHEELGLSCTLGVSNISFGLPARSLITENFLIQAMQNGLDFPIINPNIDGVMNAVKAYRVLSGEDKNCAAYIECFAEKKEEEPPKKQGLSEEGESIESAILKGLKEKTAALTGKHLESMTEMEVINRLLIPALDVVGERYEKQILFLPQLINAANAAQAGFDLIKERIALRGGESLVKGKIALATVKGDIHDIGKNIVKVILENYGYKMIDLGRDVPVERVVETVLREDLQLLGLSALMTTTLPSMKATIEAVRAVKPECKIWVGGAVLTPEYAMEMGADYYAKDARASVDIAREVLG